MFGRCIYTSPSGYKIYQNFLYRWLTLGSTALQTVINRRTPQKPVLYYLPALTLMARSTPGDCCLLGLGGAGVAHMIASSNYPITAVDSSDEIINIARQLFLIERFSNLTLIHQNATDFVQNSTQQYQHLIIDLYNAHCFPPECNNDDFFIHCMQRISNEGFMAINLANIKEQYPIAQLLKRHFKNTLIIPIKKSANMVIIASNHDQTEQFINQIQRSKEIKKISLVSSWGLCGHHNYRV